MEAELHDRGLDIRDWHRGDLSSRRVLAVLENWPTSLQIMARIVNEIHGMRADLRVAFKQKPLTWDPIEAPNQMVESYDEQQLSRDLHDDLMAAMRGENLD